MAFSDNLITDSGQEKGCHCVDELNDVSKQITNAKSYKLQIGKKEKILLKKIFDFDWNTGSNASITIQESFMLHTLNDFGVQINPQTTHIIF